jgi:metal-sulfur cluster biosynthetic enzyme
MKEERKKLILKKLEEVLDPELQISIVDLGLVYDIFEKDGKVKIKMTLTTIGCPLFGLIENEVKKKLKEIKDIKEVQVELTFDPPWTPDRLSEKAKSISFYLYNSKEDVEKLIEGLKKVEKTLG